jgi:hypothetical protein
MRSLVLGALIVASLGVASFGLAANAAEPPSDARTVSHHARRPACHWSTADRTLRLLRDILPGERRIAIESPMTRPVSAPAKQPVVKVSRPVSPVRVASRAEPVRVIRAEAARILTRVSLVVGIGY